MLNKKPWGKCVPTFGIYKGWTSSDMKNMSIILCETVLNVKTNMVLWLLSQVLCRDSLYIQGRALAANVYGDCHGNRALIHVSSQCFNLIYAFFCDILRIELGSIFASRTIILYFYNMWTLGEYLVLVESINRAPVVFTTYWTSVRRRSFQCLLVFVPARILYKSIAGRYRPFSYTEGPITARFRFIKNASWDVALWLIATGFCSCFVLFDVLLLCWVVPVWHCGNLVGEEEADCFASRKHTYLILTPLNPILI